MKVKKYIALAFGVVMAISATLSGCSTEKRQQKKKQTIKENKKRIR